MEKVVQRGTLDYDSFVYGFAPGKCITMPELTELALSIEPGSEVDIRELEQLTHQLQQEVAELDVEAVHLVRLGDIPQRAKVGDPITWGTLLVALVASGGVLTALITAVQSWLTTHERCTVSLQFGEDKLDLKSLPSAERQQLIQARINHHSGG